MQPLIELHNISKSYATTSVASSSFLSRTLQHFLPVANSSISNEISLKDLFGRDENEPNISEQLVLKNINLSIYSSELIAIMGASGSGKTTLMNLLGLLDTPTDGQYILQGNDVTGLTEDARASIRNRAIGFVFQSFFLLPRLSILENVSLPLYYRGTPDDEMNERAFAALSKVGLAQLSQRKPNQLSGGQQQRVAIARALVGQPTFILADEPTGSLDSVTGQMIMDAFIELNQKEKVTIIIVTHDAQIAKQCQRVIHLQDGELKKSLENNVLDNKVLDNKALDNKALKIPLDTVELLR